MAHAVSLVDWLNVATALILHCTLSCNAHEYYDDAGHQAGSEIGAYQAPDIYAAQSKTLYCDAGESYDDETDQTGSKESGLLHAMNIVLQCRCTL